MCSSPRKEYNAPKIKQKQKKNKNKNQKNLPQIIIQWLYLNAINSSIFNDLTTLISFIFSVLSITVSIIIFVLNFQEMTEGIHLHFISFCVFIFLSLCLY